MNGADAQRHVHTRESSGDGGGYDAVPDIGALYDHVPVYVSRRDVAFYMDVAREAEDGEVLEIGCGTGRVLMPIARAGIRVTGLDRSAAMLARLRDHLADELAAVREHVTLVEADMCSFDMGRSFGVILAPFRPMQHLVRLEDQLAFLDRVRDHLVAGGRFAFDVFNPDLARLASPPVGEVEDTPPTPLPDGRTFRRASRIVAVDHARQVSQIELIYSVTDRNGREQRHIHAFEMRWFLPDELRALVQRSGLTILEMYGDFDRSPLTGASPEIIVVATRS